MKRITIFTLIVLLFVSLAYAANRPQGQFRPVGEETITVDNTVGGKALTATEYISSGRIISDFALIRIEGAQLRYFTNGSAPTSTVGTPALPYETIMLQSYDELVKFRAIRTGTTSATITVNYYLWTP